MRGMGLVPSAQGNPSHSGGVFLLQGGHQIFPAFGLTTWSLAIVLRPRFSGGGMDTAYTERHSTQR